MTAAGDDFELVTLFDAAQNNDTLEWSDVIPCVEGQGPLLFVARTNKGYARELTLLGPI
jgi:hypothetical protein